jgi:CRP-like cAMP-binding protein
MVVRTKNRRWQDLEKGSIPLERLALREVVLACVQKISSELGNEPGLARCCRYLELLSEGMTCRQISEQLGLSREHVSRVYRRKALELVTEEFLATIGNGR